MLSKSHVHQITIKVRNRTDIHNIIAFIQYYIEFLVMQYDRKKKLNT